MSTLASVVIPAHNEATVIGRCLTTLLRDAKPGEFEVIVACNGCTDDTALIARSFSGVQVIELETPSKLDALNAADDVAQTFPRIYLDADIELSTGAARATAQILRDGAMIGAPTPRFAVSGRSFMVRSFCRAWLRTPFMQSGVIGNGVYGLSEVARQKFDRFPKSPSADDLFIYATFNQNERVTLVNETFLIYPPRSLRGLISIRTRHYGNSAIFSLVPELHSTFNSRGSAVYLLKSVRTPSQLVDALIYLGINSFAKLNALKRRSQHREHEWLRDESARV